MFQTVANSLFNHHALCLFFIFQTVFLTIMHYVCFLYFKRLNNRINKIMSLVAIFY